MNSPLPRHKYSDDPRNLCISISGGYQPRSKRLFEPIENDWVNEDDGKHKSQEEIYGCVKCAKLHLIEYMWSATLCLKCHEGEKEKCAKPTSISIPSAVSESCASTTAPTTLVRGLNSKASKNFTSSPPESNAVQPSESEPESMGWKKEHGEYTKGEFTLHRVKDMKVWGLVRTALRYNFRGDKAWLKKDGSFGTYSLDNDYDFARWQEADALAFPNAGVLAGKREFKKGDLVECLPDEEYERLCTRPLNQQTIKAFFESRFVDKLHMASLEGTNIWPLRSLKLISPVEEKA